MKIDNEKIKGLLSLISNESIEFEKSMNALTRKQTGSYYTAMDLTLAMMRELVDTLDKKKAL